MTSRVFVAVVAGVAAFSFATVAFVRESHVWPNAKTPAGASFLPSGMRISPVGRSLALAGDMPLKMSLSADGQKLLVLTGGFHNHGLTTLDLASDSAQTKSMSKCSAGLTEVGSGRVVVAAADLGLASIDLASGESKPLGSAAKGSWYAGTLKLPDGTIAAVDMNHDKVEKVDPASGLRLSDQVVGYRPYALALSPDRTQLAVGEWGAGTVTLLSPSDLKVQSTVKVGSHPNDLVFGKDGTLYISNGGSDTVTIIRQGKVAATVFTSPNPRGLLGCTPDALALSPDGKTLYVADADANCVAVVDVKDPDHPRSLGFIPTGWYPSALCCSVDGKRLYVGVGKGLASRENKDVLGTRKMRSYDQKFSYEYIGDCLSGSVTAVDLPDARALGDWTKLVVGNAKREGADQASAAQEREGRDALKNIKHVVYVIRENRTYDQVFGDLAGTNADPSITMYGEKITPNAHAMARRWVALDNLYCDGEVSQDGHQWCNAAYVTDFTERAWETSYSGRKEPDADDRLTASPFGYLWDDCRKHGRSYRSYGEFASFKSSPSSAPVFTGDKGLEGHACEAWSKKTGRDYDLVDTFIGEMHEAEKTGSWPQFMVMSLGEDHTSGLTAGRFTPFASVASNDFAIGKMVEAISRSKFWKDTAIFVIEDDAQNGADHVDCHRTVGLVVSPFVRRGVVDSTMYCTASMLRTMEIILGLPPLNAHDAAATPMFASFTTQADFSPYSLVAAQIDLQAKNPKVGEGAALSRKLDLSAFDRADPELMNRILWMDAHPGRPAPHSVYAAKRLSR